LAQKKRHAPWGLRLWADQGGPELLGGLGIWTVGVRVVRGARKTHPSMPRSDAKLGRHLTAVLTSFSGFDRGWGGDAVSLQGGALNKEEKTDVTGRERKKKKSGGGVYEFHQNT